jgi:UDP-N-acetylglucosamine:LPS N-acetylglucosamine transferase
MKRFFRRANNTVTIAVRPFIDEMAIAYAAADLALCRAAL